MATSQKLTDHFLTCTVCADVFNDPCTLQCHHTFCRKCVISFTKTQPDAVAAKSMPCPFCRKWTKVTNPDRSVDQWADDFKPIFLIQGLFDSFGPGSKDSTSCNYCKERGETTLAIFWCPVCNDALCEKCILINKRIPSTRHHVVDTISSEGQFKGRRMVTCKEHTNEYIEFHCKDCKKAICQKCCIIYHRKCESVVTLESELEEMKESLTKHRDMLREKEDLRRVNTEEQKTRLSEATKRQMDITSEIEKMYKRVFDIINQKKIKLLHDVDEMTQQQTDQLRADIKTGEMATQMYQQQSELIHQALKSDSEMNVYEMYQSCESGVVDDSDTELKDKLLKTRITLINISEEVMKTLDKLELGKIDVIHEGGLDLKATPVLQDTIDVDLPGDGSPAWPADVSVLNVNGIDTVVVTDWGGENNCLKSFYNKNNQPRHSRLNVNESAWGLTQVKHNQVGVTLPGSNQILLVKVSLDLKLLSTITTQKPYRGITLLSPSTLAVGSESPPCVDILDMSGNIIRSVYPDHGNITRPLFLNTTREGNIPLSDFSSGSVLCLTPEGHVVFKYSDKNVLMYATGITGTTAGDILVADWSLQSVIHLSESGQFVRKILTPQDGLKVVWGVFLEKSGRLYVCDYKSGFIKVFTIRQRSREKRIMMACFHKGIIDYGYNKC